MLPWLPTIWMIIVWMKEKEDSLHSGYQVVSTYYLFCENTYPIHAYCFINTYLLHTFGSQRYIPFNRYTKYDFLHFDFEFKISNQLACLKGMQCNQFKSFDLSCSIVQLIQYRMNFLALYTLNLQNSNFANSKFANSQQFEFCKFCKFKFHKLNSI